MNRKHVTTILVVLLLGTMFGGAATAADIEAKQGTIRVNGQAVISAEPDIAYVTLGVESKDPSAQAASQDNAQRMENIMAALKDLGIGTDQISTSRYSIHSYQESSRNNNTPPTTIYRVHNQIQITTSQLELVGQIIDAAVSNGANQVLSIRFDVLDKQELTLLAFERAAEQAWAKAEAIARGARVTIGGVENMAEQWSSYAPVAEAMMMRSDAAHSAPTQINPGDVEISAQINATFWY